MKFKALYSGVELPEKSGANHWINVRASERIDVCFGDQVRVTTGIHVTVAKNETARVTGPNVVEMNVSTGELFITAHNEDKQNLMIYPGQVLAEILVEKAPVKASKPRRRKTRITSPAKLITNESG